MVDTLRPTRTDVHTHLRELLQGLAVADERRVGAFRYELTRVIDEHLFDVHHAANRPPSAAVGDAAPALGSLRAALRSVCLGEPPKSIAHYLRVHEAECPLRHARGTESERRHAPDGSSPDRAG